MDAARELQQGIGDLMNSIAIKMQVDLRRQSPRRGNTPNNPYATGTLVKAVNVRSIEDNGSWSIQISYPEYGNYTAFGTRKGDRAFKTRQLSLSIFDREPFKGYESNKGQVLMGIRPQNWLSLAAQKQKYEKLIEKELSMSLEVFIDSLTNMGIRTR
jgi:hypothetical protein